MKPECYFCDVFSLAEDRENLLWEDDRIAAFLHEDRAVEGHAVVVWKRHVENISDLSGADATHLMSMFASVERAILRATSRERSIIMKLGLAVAHLHLHVYPFGETAGRADVFAAIHNEAGPLYSEEEAAALRRSIQRILAAELGSA